MATYPIDAYMLRKKLVDKYGLRLDLDGQEVLKGVIAEICKRLHTRAGVLLRLPKSFLLLRLP